MPFYQELPTLSVCVGLATLALLLPRTFPEARWTKRLPPPLWCYGLPMLLRGFGLITVSPEFLQGLISLLLPSALFLVLLPTPLMRLRHVGPQAVGAMLVGAIGIILGGLMVYVLFRGGLPADGWQSLSLLSGSWMGGSLNMLAMREALQAPESLLGPMILVDSLIVYSWFAFLLFLSPRQAALDRWLKAKPLSFKEMTPPIVETRSPSSGGWFLVGLIVLQALLCLVVSRILPPILGFSQKTWGILLATVLALCLSRSRLVQQQKQREETWGKFLLYFVLSAVGFQGNFQALMQTPLFLLVGIVWVFLHAGLLLVVGRCLHIPFGLLATASQANLGGVVTAPLVGATYHPSLAPVGLLLAILGGVFGTTLGLLCAFLLRLLAVG